MRAECSFSSVANKALINRYLLILAVVLGQRIPMAHHTISTNFQMPQRNSSNSLLRSNATGIPRIGGMIWQSLIGAKYSRSYMHAKLTAIESFYIYNATVHPRPSLDQILVRVDTETLEFRLKGFLAHLQNKAALNDQDYSRTWQSVISFVTETLDFLIPAFSSTKISTLKASLRRIERMYKSLKPIKNLRPSKLRALPSTVVEEMYSIMVPASPTNPYRTLKLQKRNYTIFLLLLHQGLRKGEILTLRADAIQHEYDPNDKRDRFWLNVVPSNLIDVRKRQPALKNQGSIRQIPMSGELASILWDYLHNWRGRCPHGFFFTSERNRPLSLRAISYVIEKLNDALSNDSSKTLRTQRIGESVSMHDFRHTCATLRLKGFLQRGVPMDEAEMLMRAFFGWTRTSSMPRLYAKAYYDERLQDVWGSDFDNHVNVIRGISQVCE